MFVCCHYFFFVVVVMILVTVVVFVRSFSFFLLLANKMVKVKEKPDVKTSMLVKELKISFNLSFFCTAINLSLAVIWMGILYKAINTLEATQFYSTLTGTPYVSHDPVYLTGLLHSVLLLIFYLPVKLQFDFEQNAEQTVAQGSKVVNSVWKLIASIIVTASPLLSAILQKFVGNLLG